MTHPETPEAAGRYATCRNLVWETSPDDGEKRPSRYCSNRLGVVHYLDCPVYQGVECCLFVPREGEEPEPASPEGLDELRGRLAEDYLRWSYWKRVSLLRGSEPPADVRKKVSAQPEEEEDELAELVRHQTKPSVDDAPLEKYPGQHRSEDRRARREPGDPAPVEQVLEPGPPEKAEEDRPGQDPAERENPGSEKDAPTEPLKRRRRRSRRSRGRRGKKPPAP